MWTKLAFFVIQFISQIVIQIYRFYIYVFYFMLLNTFFSEVALMFHQTHKGVYGTKKKVRKPLWYRVLTYVRYLKRYIDTEFTYPYLIPTCYYL